MQQENFKILSASAGAGKTYRLTKSYLLHLLQNNSLQNFRNLLAITFTNKAVTEMKQRILEGLFSFASSTSQSEKNPLFKEVAEKLNLKSSELVKRSRKVLENLLHNYAFFDVSTIDAFNHRLIRTFAKDLNISQNFEVELDTDLVLGRAVNQVLGKAGKDEELTSILIDFALEKIDKGKSWNIAYDLNEIGKLLFNENHHHHLKKLSKKHLGEFIELKKSIAKKIDGAKSNMQEKAAASQLLIAENQIELSDFSRGSLPKFLQQVIDNPSNIDFNAKWKNSFEETPLYNKTLDQIRKSTIDSIRPELEKYFTSIKNDFNKLSFLYRCQKNVVPLALISEIQKEINLLKEEGSFVTINEFNDLISSEIKKQPIPYIYERLGERYRHYYIDEFQDTSILQWENLAPLIGHALESANDFGQQGSLLLVGDVKQSIYRWRGGEPQQFLHLIQGDKNPFTITSQVEQLLKNWRSYDEIIKFNNGFFSFISSKLQNVGHQNLYLGGNRQLANEKKGGIVSVSFIENDKNSDSHSHCQKTLDTLIEIKNKGYAHADICILVRNKSNEKLLAEYLTENEIPVVSSEGLVLENDEVVSFLISFLEFVLHPLEKEHTFSILAFLFKDSSTLHDAILKYWSNLSEYLYVTYDINIEELRFNSTLNLIETIISKLNLVPKSNAYVIAFLDVVTEYEKTNTEGIYGFLENWYVKKSKLVLPMPEGIDAVKIMTIHKSKGLEFPFVIFPFADDKINDSRKQNDIWIPVEPNEHSGFKELLLTNNKFIPYYSDEAANAHNNENEKSELDDFNVLYVALTRAIRGLYIISSPTKEKMGQNSYASLLVGYLESQNCSTSQFHEITFGSLEANENVASLNEHEIVPYINSKISISDFEIAKQEVSLQKDIDETIRFGNLVHSLLADIYCDDDIISSIKKHIEVGLLKESEVENIENLLLKVTQNENLKRFFVKNLDSKNESELLAQNGEMIRPDRLVFNQGKVSVIDYKTGVKSESHRYQIQQYADTLSKMGYQIENKVLVYIDKEINTIAV